MPVKLIVQPGAGADPIVAAIRRARTSLDLTVFRFDWRPIAEELEAAVHRGVAVRVLIARRNDKNLRKLEARLVEAGADVARTNGDLLRYHDKVMIEDRRRLFVMGFNLTRADLVVSRSFALVVESPRVVREAHRLFSADFGRRPYRPALPNLVVSPHNSRKVLRRIIRGARRRLLVYAPQLDDPKMLAELEARAVAGVDVRVLGNVALRGHAFAAQRYPGRRLHVRAVVRDGREVYVGSQGLRRQELDLRREVGLVVTAPPLARRITACFNADWRRTPLGRKPRRRRITGS
jgi:cardiolipin synthase A/B